MIDMLSTKGRILNYKCEVFGNLFKLSTKLGFDSKEFVRTVMTYKKLDWLFEIDDCQDWCDAEFLLYTLEKHITFKTGATEDEYLMWFTGYLYKYWINTRNVDRKEVYKILPLSKMKKLFPFYHTQDWDYIIDKETGRGR